MDLILTALISLIVTATVGNFLIPALKRLRAGQSILQDGPTWHAKKEGTPTMGGLMFVCGTLVAVVVMGWRAMQVKDFTQLALLGFSAIFGLIGFIDDFQKVKHHQNLGLTAWQKFLLQVAASVAFLCLMRYTGMLEPEFYVPFFNVTLRVNWTVYLILSAFIVVGTVNAVNLTDGVDGLASSVTLPVTAFFCVIAKIWPGVEQMGIFSAALFGGLVGFLLYNFHPAKVFMGDTGSLFLGGAVAGLAFACNMPLVLLPVGIIYFCEALSDILQVGYFKLTHGKRIFKMAPLHHHFELSGWSEVKVVIVFTLVSVIGCVLALWGVHARYWF